MRINKNIEAKSKLLLNPLFPTLKKGIIQLFIVSLPKVPEFWCSFLCKIREGDKYVYFLEFETRSEKGPRCAYYIDAYDGKILFKDVYYYSDKKLNDSFDPDFPKEKILVPVRDSLSLDDTY